MNNMNEFKNLKKWCEKHYEDTKIRVHASNVPVQTLLNEILGRVEAIERVLLTQTQESKKPVVKKKLTAKKEEGK